MPVPMSFAGHPVLDAHQLKAATDLALRAKMALYALSCVMPDSA
jgi:hypothetical protein